MMKIESVTIVRIYLREGEELLSKVVTFLHDDSRITGMTVLRGVEGFSENGPIHRASLLDLSLDLPLVIEFYDVPERVETVVQSLLRRFPLPHLISWPAQRVVSSK